MSFAQGSTSGLVAVHVAQQDPATVPPLESTAEAAGDWLGRRRERRSRFADPAIDWQRHGLEPRWLDMETSECAAAIDPSIFHGHGGTELERFLAGTQARGEVALAVATIGDADDEFSRNVFGTDASVLLPGGDGSISGRRLPTMTRATPAPGVKGADKDLALRLLNRPHEAAWWSISVSGTTLESPMGMSETRDPGGRLEPILVDSLGDPIVAVWISDFGDQRWYAIPDASEPDVVLDWLISQALPEHVPGALRRVRARQAVVPTLQTPGEDAARRELADLEATFERERDRLSAELRRATEAAEPIRDGLLYGTGSELVDAVSSVLRAAGLTVTELDDALGDTTSADLLVFDGRRRRLVEVKSAGGSAGEKLVAALERHLQTWPQLRPQEPVDGGVLVVNHQHKLDPDNRSPEVFTRPEFVAALTVTVLSSRRLFDWWRYSDWEAIQAAVMGTAERPTSTATSEPQPDAGTRPPSEPENQRRPRRWWSRGERNHPN